jgi:long-chain acyl-CoA synthetase
MEVNKIIDKIKSSEGVLVTFYNRKRVEMPYSLLYSFVLKGANFFKSKKFDNNTVLGIIGKNDLEWVVADLAAISCGVKLLPLDLNSDISQYQNEQLKVSALLISDEYTEQINYYSSLGYNCICLSELMNFNNSDIDFKPYCYKNEEVFSYKSTSGSTGFPKIMGHSYEAVNNSIIGIQEMYNHKKSDRVLVFLPLNLLQQRYWLYSSILYGFKVIIIPKENIFISIRNEKPTVIMGVPYIYEFLKNEFEKKIEKDLILKQDFNNYLNCKTSEEFKPFIEFLGGSIRYLWTGSAPISNQIIEFYEKLGVRMFQGYGMNEVCIISKNYFENNKIGSVGKPFLNIKIKFDEDNQILIKNKYPVCKHYTISSVEEDKQTFIENGYIATGDIGFIDDDGYLFINGRIKEMIALSNSKKIYPVSIENKIASYDQIQDCILYGDDKPHLVAMIIPRSINVSHKEIKDMISDYNLKSKSEEQILNFFIEIEKFSEENGLLSNQNKIKRKKIIQKYNKQFEQLYK